MPIPPDAMSENTKERRGGKERRAALTTLQQYKSYQVHRIFPRFFCKRNKDRRSPVAREALKACGHEAGGYWAIHYHDQDRPREVFTSEDSAIRRWNQISDSWNADLFIRIRRNYNDQNDL